MGKLQALNLQLCRKKFQIFIYLLRTTAHQGKLQRKEYEFRNAMYIILLMVYLTHFLLFQFVRLTDLWATFYKTKMNHLKNGQHLLSSTINKKKEKHAKYSVVFHNGKYSA